MADNDGEILLGITVDPSGADSGTAAVQADLGKVKDSAVDAGEGINNSLDNRRAVTHALRGLMELREGGIMALAGLASEGFVVTEAFEGMLGPLAPILMTLTLIASIGIPMLERMKDGTKETKDNTDDWKTANDEVNESIKTGLEAATTQLKEYLEVQVQVIAGEQQRAGFAQQAIKDAEAHAAAVNKLTLAELEAQKQRDLRNATSQADRDTIEATYKAREASASGADADTKHQLELQALDAQHKSDLEQQRTLQQQNTDDAGKLDTLQKAVRDAAVPVTATPDAAGNYKDAIAAQEKAFEAAQANLQKLEKENAPTRSITAAQNEMIAESGKLADLRDLQKAIDALKDQGDPLKERLQKNSESLDKVNDALSRYATQVDTANTNYAADKTKEETEREAAEDAGQNKTLEDDAAKRKAGIDNEIQERQNKLDLLGPDDPARQQLEQEIAKFKSDLIENEKNLKIDTGQIDPDGPEAKGYDLRAQGAIDAAKGKADDQAARDQKKAQQQETRSDNTEDGDLIRTAASTIQSFGTNKSDLSALKDALANHKSNPQGSMQELITELTTVLGEHTNATGAWVSNVKNQISQLQTQIRALQGRTAYPNNSN